MLTYDQKQITTPARAGFNYVKPALGLVEWMPIYEHGKDVTIKVVGYHPDNPQQFDLPTIISSISAYDTQTGHLIGIMDGVLPTALRTGAASAIAAKYMAKASSTRLGLLGCGAQSVTQLHGLSRIFPLEEVYIYDTNPLALTSFAQRIAPLNLKIDVIPASLEEVVAQVDILVTATSIDVGAGPLFEDLHTQPHLHINAIGSDFPGKIEVPKRFLKKSFVCPDFLAQAVIEGECQQLDREDIDAEIVQLVQDPRKYEFVKNQTSVYDSTGWALQDKLTFALFMELGKELGMGQLIEIENMSGDASNPYDFMQEKEPLELRVLETLKSQEG